MNVENMFEIDGKSILKLMGSQLVKCFKFDERIPDPQSFNG